MNMIYIDFKKFNGSSHDLFALVLPLFGNALP